MNAKSSDRNIKLGMRRTLNEMLFALLLTLALCGTSQFVATSKAYLPAAPGEIGQRHVYHGLAWSPWRTVHCDWPAGAPDDVCANPRVEHDAVSWSVVLFLGALVSILLLPWARRRAKQDVAR